MKTIIQLFSIYPKQVSTLYLSKAIHIENQLLKGISYQELRGCSLVLCRNLIRFKLGAYRLIFMRGNNGFSPLFLIKRKDLDMFLKRRCS